MEQDGPEPLLISGYRQDRCPGCGKPFERPCYRTDEETLIPGHTTGMHSYDSPVCWLGGWTVAEAKDMLRMQGERRHAAHP